MAAQPSALEQKLVTLEQKLADLKAGRKKAENAEQQEVVIHRTEAAIREVRTAIADEAKPSKK